nr:DUF6531 domain-containing protein [Myxococcus sp. MH1]
MQTGRRAVGHPVDVASGVQFTAAHDVEIWGTVPLIFRRTYSTDLLDQPASILGRGWLHNLDARLSRDLEGFRFVGHGGLEVFFDDPSGRLDTGASLFNLGDSMELRREGDRLVVYHWHDLETDVQRYVFSADDGDPMLLRALEIPSGHGLLLKYDRAKRLTSVTQSAERRAVHLKYDASGRLAMLQLAMPGADAPPPVTVARYVYDARDRLVAVHDAADVPMTYGYDAEDRLTEERNRAGGAYFMKYDAQGRCIEAAGEGGYNLRRFQYDAVARLTQVTDSLGHVTAYQYNARGQVEREILPNGGIRATEYDEHGRPVVEVGPAKDVTTYVYDDRGDVATKLWPDGTTTRFEYDEHHQAVSITESGGAVWRMRYERGALVHVLEPLGGERLYVRDANNDVVAIHTPGGNRILVSRDPSWTETRLSDGYGLIERRRLDARLNPTEIEDASGALLRLRYDVLGRLVQVEQPDGATERMTYDAEGLLTRRVDGAEYVHRLEHSAFGQCVRAIDPNGLVSEYTWDTEGRLTRVRNPAGELATFEYDSVGNLVAQQRFDGATERFEYDLGGNVLRHHKPGGTVVESTYDISGNLLQLTSGTQDLLRQKFAAHGQLVESWTPDATVRFERDLLGRVTAEVQNGLRVQYTYHPSGGVARREFEGARAEPLVLDYDLRGRLRSMGTAHGTFQSFRYDARDYLTSRELGPAREDVRCDARGNLVGQSVHAPNQEPLVERSYVYARNGELLGVQDPKWGSRGFEYDPGRRLLAAHGPSSIAGRYAYDELGNLTRKGHQSLSYAPGGVLVGHGATRFTHGPNGQRLRASEGDQQTRFHWDALDQLREVQHPDGSKTTYGYDGTGRRVFKEHEGRRTSYYWAGNDLLSEQGPRGVTDYAIDNFWLHALWEDGELRHAIVSQLGVPRELLDEAGQCVWRGEYDAWGNLVHQEGSARAPSLRLPGQFWDEETGLHYNRSRYYDPAAGQFISADPTGFAGGPNLFLYAPNPIGWDDPFGLRCGSRTSGWSVYVLTRGEPPQVVYVGITNQHPHERLSQHRSGHSPGSFDHMRVVATGLSDRRAARNIEGSALFHLAVPPPAPPLLLNRTRLDGGYWHSYRNNGDTTRPLMSASATLQQLGNNIITLPR